MSHSPAKKTSQAALTLGALGVVYGDIGTSPLYAFRESIAAVMHQGGAATPEVVLGLLSLVLWSLFIIVTLKYVVLLLRADNQGEGGILSLMALVQQAYGKQVGWVVLLGMAGAALFYGDALITPAISILSAVEGVKLVTPVLAPHVMPIAIFIIVVLCWFQRYGTEKVARFFAPCMLVWFVVLAAGGLMHIQDTPQVWQAFNPAHALGFMTHHGKSGFIALGAVFLAVTGAEALYADMGHFGKRPIRIAWLLFVMPALVLNYMGQAALVMANPETAEHSFFLLYPDWALPWMVVLATLATIIASQAVITGAYSLTHQAIQLGLLPRLRVLYTSATHAGQIYIPQVNWLLMAGVILLIALFRNSSALASAYGIAVTGTMVITAIFMFIVAQKTWHWPMPVAVLVVVPFLVIDLAFFSANLTKLFEGGFVPVMLSIVLILMMQTWVRGSRYLLAQTREHHYSMEALNNELNRRPLTRIDGAAVYLTSDPHFAPSALLQNMTHNKVLHETNILLTLKFENTPYMDEERRVEIERLKNGFSRVYLYFGYMEAPNVTRGLTLLRQHGIVLDLMSTTFFISRRNIVPSAQYGMPLWQDRIYIAMANNATDAADYFHIPLNRVVELGVQLTV